MAAVNYADVLYEQSNGLDDIARALKGAVAKTGAKISVLLFSCDGDLAKEFVERAPADRHPRADQKGGKEVLSIDGEDGVPIRIVVAGDSRTPTIRYALSDCSPTLFKGKFVSLAGRHIPALSKFVLSNAEMVKVLDAIADRDFDIKVKYVSTATMRREGGLDSHTDHVNEPYKKFLDSLEEGATIKTIKFECAPAGLADEVGASGPAVLTMTRDCCFTASHSAKALFDEVLPLVAKMAELRIEHLRFSTSTANRRTPEPLIINFGRDIFADPTRNKGHIAALASMPGIGISVYHANPYLHASLVDYSDGSSYDIWVLVSDRLAIIPQIFASETSMGRLVNHIFKNIGGGKIEKYEKKAVGR